MKKRCMGCMELYGQEFEVCPFCGFIDGTKLDFDIESSILHNRYIVGRTLYWGYYSRVYISWDTSIEQKVMIEEYFCGRDTLWRDRLKKEIQLLTDMKPIDCIARIYNMVEEENSVYVICEHVEGETLKSILMRKEKLEAKRAVSILLPLMLSLQTIHKQGIIHRYLMPGNLVIAEDWSIKVIGFGGDDWDRTVAYVPGYHARELFMGPSQPGPYTDVYSMAAILYEMISGKKIPEATERCFGTVVKPLSLYCPNIEKNIETAIHNALNMDIKLRTPTMTAFVSELTAKKPVVQVKGRISKFRASMNWKRVSEFEIS